MVPRRAQTPITIRSDRAAQILKRHTRFGRSQAEVIEEALGALPDVEPPEGMSDEDARQFVRLKRLIGSVSPNAFLSIGEFDALEYDEHGDPR